MEDKLRLNTKLYGGFEGIIGRRDFFLNTIVYISSISLVAMYPFLIWLYTNSQMAEDFFNLGDIFFKAPIFCQIWTLLGMIITCLFLLSNVIRRLNDINGKINNKINFIVSLFCTISCFTFLQPLGYSLIFLFINFIFSIILFFKKGKITGNYPYDFRKEFNWGAFLGTWVWGLFNKSYKTLWATILSITPFAGQFALYCGLKGNEWAFMNKKCTDISSFNKGQEKQAIIFAIIQFLIFPIVYTLIFSAIVTLLVMGFTENSIKNNPKEFENKMETFSNKLDDSMNYLSSVYFEKHKITEQQNKFYVKSSDWKTYTFKEKVDMLDFAASLSANERRKIQKSKNPNSHKLYSKSSELMRTKIYCYETNELLGEFIMDENTYETGSFKEFIKESLKAYRFYNL